MAWLQPLAILVKNRLINGPRVCLSKLGRFYMTIILQTFRAHIRTATPRPPTVLLGQAWINLERDGCIGLIQWNWGGWCSRCCSRNMDPKMQLFLTGKLDIFYYCGVMSSIT